MSIGAVFNLNKIKFSKLDELDPIKKSRVRIFINLECALKRLSTQYTNNQLMIRHNILDTKKELLSNIINLAQHYRLYCAKQNIESEIYLYWNYPCRDFKNLKYNHDYRRYYTNKFHNNIQTEYVNKCISEIFDQLVTVIKYINQVYLLTSDNIESSLLPYVIDKNNDFNGQNIIVSSDKYDLQYVLHGFDILVPSGCDSRLVDKSNIIDTLKDISRVTCPNNIPINYVPFALALLGDKYRSIPKIQGVGLTTIINVINKGLENKLLTEHTSSVEMLSKIIKENMRELFINNYHCVNLEYQYQDLTETDIHKINSLIVDKFDDNAIIYMNDKYFKDHLIMLVETRSEQLNK